MNMMVEGEPPVVADDGSLNDDDDSLDSVMENGGHPGNTENVQSKTTATSTKNQQPGLGRRETRAVVVLRRLFVAVWIVTAAAVSSSVYFIVHRQQVEAFESASQAHTTKLLQALAATLQTKMGAINTLGVALSAHSKDTNQQFPNVTMASTFAPLAADARVHAQTVHLYYSPVVYARDKVAWEAYAMSHHTHLMEDFVTEQIQKAAEDMRYNYTNPFIPGATLPFSEEDGDDSEEEGGQRLLQDEAGASTTAPTTNGTTASASPVLTQGYVPFVHGFSGEGPMVYENDDDVLLPLWHMSPVLPAPYLLNFDLLSFPEVNVGYRKALESEQIVLDAVTDLRDADETGQEDGASSALYNLFLQMGQFRHVSNESAIYGGGDPLSGVSVPVFDTTDVTTRKIAGLITTSFYWRLFFMDVLPADARGLIVVLQNHPQNQTFSYRVDGAVATYLGIGDYHSSAFDHLGQTVDLSEYVAQNTNPTTTSYTTAPLNGEHCRYRLSVYPSAHTEADHVDNQPLIFAFVVAAVFCLCGLLFALYNILVERRQTVVMDSAVKTAAVVTELFPDTVRDRLLQDQESTKTKGAKNRKAAMNGQTWKASHHEKDGHAGLPALMENVSSNRPIADKFDEATVLFADLAGFTQWASSRDPEAVFLLLETLYAAFDQVADRKNVYKIETIGDCYLAVTGVPTYQSDHAPRMVQFARAIMLKLRLLKATLAEKLGSDTRDLELRIGIHSGNVTAGVLRGQKSRFQLFGDTVNTAARLESHGKPGCIHVSEAVAEHLRVHQKGHWLQVRADPIHAKGKGEMTTYWVTPEKGGTSTTSGWSVSSVSGAPYVVHPIGKTLGSVGENTTGSPLDDDAELLEIQQKLSRRVSA